LGGKIRKIWRFVRGEIKITGENANIYSKNIEKGVQSHNADINRRPIVFKI
jgi:hypothetical protein